MLRLRKPEYLLQPARYADRVLIEKVIHEELAQQTSAYWIEKLRAARVPCGPVNDFAQALSDTQVLARDMVVEVPLAGGGSVRMPGTPMKFSGSAMPEFQTPPPLGHDTDAVLSSATVPPASKPWGRPRHPAGLRRHWGARRRAWRRLSAEALLGDSR